MEVEEVVEEEEEEKKELVTRVGEDGRRGQG